MKRAVVLYVLLVVLVPLLTLAVAYGAGFRVFQMPTAGMSPTIAQGGKVLVRLSPSVRGKVERFEVIVHRFHLPGQEPVLYVKRVVGLPGERVEVSAEGVRVNGESLTLPASMDLAGLRVRPCSFSLGPEDFFLLGDNLAHSADSRFFGPVAGADVVGRVLFRR